MKNGFGLVTLLITGGILVIVGATVAAAYTFTQKNDRKIGNLQNQESRDSNFGQLEKDESKLNENSSGSGDTSSSPAPGVSPRPAPSNTSSSASTNDGDQITYTQPQGIYLIILPAGWVVNSTFATKTYSTTKFTGPIGNISITLGTGKDPVGGCSEASAIVLADRAISGCYLLQKDGSKILTRAYTKTSGNQQITIEAFINPSLADNQPIITSIIKTIDVK